MDTPYNSAILLVMQAYTGHPDQNLGHVTYAQNGEDIMLLNLVNLLGLGTHSKKPLWLDVGAHHPTNISNTRLLYNLGYTGVNVEANPNLMPAFHLERPRDLNLNVAIGLGEGLKTFYMYDATSGRNTFCEEEKNACEKFMQVRERMELPTITITQLILNFIQGRWPPLLLLDVEGWDYDILESANFADSGPQIIVAELRKKQTFAAREMMSRQSYTQVCRLGENMIFCRNEHLHKIY